MSLNRRACRSGTAAVSDHARLAKFPACRLWERSGLDGKPFLSGCWGNVRVLVVRNPDRSDDDDATHLLVLCEAAPQVRKPRNKTP